MTPPPGSPEEARALLVGSLDQLRLLNAGLNALNANLIKLGQIQEQANRINLELGTRFGQLAEAVDDAAGSAQRGTVVGEALDALAGLAGPPRRRRRR